MNCTSRISVGIATKGRPQELANTLRKLTRWLPEVYQVIVVDDGSQPAISTADLPGLGEKAFIVRNKSSIGYIGSRNKIIALCPTPYCLFLDDDSYIVSGSLLRLTDWMDANSIVAVAALPYTEGVSRVRRVRSLADEPYRVRSFVGCANVQRVNILRELGGYDESYVHQCEEGDFSFRLIKEGYAIFHYPGVGIHHEAASTSRNFDRMAYYGTRNNLLTAYKHYPTGWLALSLVRGLRTALRGALRERRPAFLRGLIAGYVVAIKNRHIRRPMKAVDFKNYRNLPQY